MNINHHHYHHHHHHHFETHPINPNPLLISVTNQNHPILQQRAKLDWNVHNTSNNYASAKSSNNYATIKNLRLQMNEIHLSYINRDESTIKTKLRKRLEILINEYLTLVRHIEKISSREIRDCLEMTVKKATFDPDKFIEAFEAIERYATNLLNYPWRHEYHQIFAFSGFFYRIIKCSLVGYEEVFELLGYNYDSSLDILRLVEIPIDPDKMIQISFDCLVSIVEIQIMLDIKKKCPNDITWKDIYSIRSEYICNTQSAVQIYCDLKQNNKLIDLDLDLPDYSVKEFNKLDLWSPINPPSMDSYNKNSNQEILLPPPPSYLESDLDTIDFVDSNPSPIKESEQIKISDNSMILIDPIESCFNLPSQDHRHKQLTSSCRKVNLKNLDPVKSEQINSFEQDNNNEKNPMLDSSPNSSNRTTLSSCRSFSTLKRSYERPCNSRSISISNKDTFNRSRPQTTDLISTLMDKKSIQNETNLNHLDSSLLEGWSCASCTYVNTDPVEVCVMCHRSRTKGNESTPLVTGGRQCNKCTLVNDKKERFCKACGTSLADSPTYI